MSQKNKRLSEDNKKIIGTLNKYISKPELLSVTVGKLAVEINIDHRVICEMLKCRVSSHAQISKVGEIELLQKRFYRNNIPHLSSSISRKNKPKYKKGPKPWYREISTSIESNRRKH